MIFTHKYIRLISIISILYKETDLRSRYNKPKLHQCLPASAFQLCEPCKPHWNVVMMDAMSDDQLHFTCTRGQWTVQDIAIAAGREAAGGECVVAIQHVCTNGVPDIFAYYAVLYAWSKWHIRSI